MVMRSSYLGFAFTSCALCTWGWRVGEQTALVDGRRFEIPERIAVVKDEISCSDLRTEAPSSGGILSEHIKELASRRPHWDATRVPVHVLANAEENLEPVCETPDADCSLSPWSPPKDFWLESSTRPRLCVSLSFDGCRYIEQR